MNKQRKLHCYMNMIHLSQFVLNYNEYVHHKIFLKSLKYPSLKKKKIHYKIVVDYRGMTQI